MTTDCQCGRPTRDGAYFCDTCGDAFSVALGEVPWLDEQLDISLTSQKGVDYRRVGGGKGAQKAAERPSPVSWAASEARGNLRALLVSWARFCHEEGVRNQSPADGLPADNLPALSRYLLWRVDGLSLLDIGPEAVEEITAAVAQCHRLIDRPADRQYLGACREDDCAGRMFGRPGAKLARCETCFTTVDADEIRTRLLGELDDRLCTAAEIAQLSTYLGLKANREQVRKRINTWHKRKVISSESMFDEPAFRFGIVWRLLAHDDEPARSG